MTSLLESGREIHLLFFSLSRPGFTLQAKKVAFVMKHNARSAFR